MKRIILTALIAAIIPLLFCGCSKQGSPRSEHPFHIDAAKVRADGVCADVIPDNNDFQYMFSVLPAEMVDAYTTDAELIDALDGLSKEIYIIITEDKELKDFEQKFLYNGAYSEYYYNLMPETDYCIVAFAYTGLVPDRTLTELRFTTPKLVKSDIAFDIALNGSKICISPTNTDNYICEFDDKDHIETDYSGPFDFHEKMCNFYWEEDFIPYIINSGYKEYKLDDYFSNPKAGDQFYFTASGYNNGINSDIHAYLLTYNGSDKPGTVIPVTEER